MGANVVQVWIAHVCADRGISTYMGPCGPANPSMYVGQYVRTCKSKTEGLNTPAPKWRVQKSAPIIPDVLFPSVAAPEKALFKSWFVHPGSRRHLHIYPSSLDVALFRLWETITRMDDERHGRRGGKICRIVWPKFPSLQRQLQKGHCLASHSSGDWIFRWEINNGGLSTQTINHNGK